MKNAVEQLPPRQPRYRPPKKPLTLFCEAMQPGDIHRVEAKTQRERNRITALGAKLRGIGIEAYREKGTDWMVIHKKGKRK